MSNLLPPRPTCVPPPPPPPELLEVREKVLKWNDSYRVTINGSKMEVHNWLADFNSPWIGIDGETMPIQRKILSRNFDIEINNILNFYADWIHKSNSEYTADVLEPGNILEVKLDEVKAALKKCDKGCWAKITDLAEQKNDEVPWDECISKMCENCQKLIN